MERLEDGGWRDDGDILGSPTGSRHAVCSPLPGACIGLTGRDGGHYIGQDGDRYTRKGIELYTTQDGDQRGTGHVAPAIRGTSAAFLLADGRFPAGGHAHSGGVEGAVNDGLLRDLVSLRDFLEGRLRTAGLVFAALSSASWIMAMRCKPQRSAGSISLKHISFEEWSLLDAEADARLVSPSLRRVSRAQGRQLLRSAAVAWPSPLLDGLAGEIDGGPHHSIAMGACAAVAGLTIEESALVAAYGSISGPGFAALRLLGFDPAQVSSVVADLTGAADQVAMSAMNAARDAATVGQWIRLPAPASPLLDYYAESHAGEEVRLFAS